VKETILVIAKFIRDGKIKYFVYDELSISHNEATEIIQKHRQTENGFELTEQQFKLFLRAVEEFSSETTAERTDKYLS
jgi:hypothetical protein